MKNRFGFGVAALVLLGLVSGCGTMEKFVYPEELSALKRFSEEPLSGLTVAVVPFDDARGSENCMGTAFWYLLPLMPYGWVTYDRPEAAGIFLTVDSFEFTPSEELAKAAALSLRRSNLFKDAFFTFGGEKEKAELVLYGTILSTRYDGCIWSYGTSIACPYIWMLGAPCGTVENTLAVRFELKRGGDSIWSYSGVKKEKTLLGVYYHYGDDCRAYSGMMQQIMNEALDSLYRNSKLFGKP